VTIQLPASPIIHRHADGSIDYGFYRAEARRQRNEQRRAAWRWLSSTVLNVANRCRRGLSLDREIDIVTRLR
jgi:hypothetical protein